MRIITYNYAQELPTTVFSSSENPNFPALNIKHQIRGKEWRSNGYFVLTEANNKICFSEGAGELIATIPVGSYSTIQLRALIKQQMEAVGNLIYMVTFNSRTGLWTISASDVFTLFNETGSVVGSLLNTIGFAVSDRAGAESYTAPKIAIHTEEFIGFDFKTSEEIDSIALFWEKNKFNLSSNAIIKVQANPTQNFSAPALEQVLTFSNKFEIATHYFNAPQSYRYWRIVIVDPQNNNLYVSVGVAVFGLNEIEESPENGFGLSLVDRSKTTTTDFGHEYTDKYPVLRSLNFNLKLIEYSFVEKLISIYNKVGSKTPVFVTLAIDNEIFDKDCFAIYGKFPESILNQHYSYNIFDTGLSIREIA